MAVHKCPKKAYPTTRRRLPWENKVALNTVSCKKYIFKFMHFLNRHASPHPRKEAIYIKNSWIIMQYRMKSYTNKYRMWMHGYIPTKAAIATRPCLISDWRSQPIVNSPSLPQYAESAIPKGSKKPSAGLSLLARTWRSSYMQHLNKTLRPYKSSREWQNECLSIFSSMQRGQIHCKQITRQIKK